MPRPPRRPPPQRPSPRPRPSPRRPRPEAIPRLLEALADVERLAVLGVGSELRGDDFAGVLVARAVNAWARRARASHVAGFEGCAAPENLTGEIARFRPSHVLLVDAAHLGRAPGTVEVLDPADIAGVSFSTHMLPAPIFMGYLERTAKCRTLVVGIEPAQKDVLGPISAAVATAIEAVAATIAAAMRARRPTARAARSRPG